MEADEILQHLAGQWKLSRKFTGQPHVFVSATGSASLTTTTDGSLIYQEKVAAVLDNKATLPASRSYIYKLVDDKLAVFFAETPLRLFHTLTPDCSDEKTQALIFTGTHQCPPDTYHVKYIFCDGGNFTNFKIDYRVTGSAKNYESSTEFSRAYPTPTT
jgi:Family of unknown function (DUF6314)